MPTCNNEAYRRAQLAMAELKAAVRTVLEDASTTGLTNAQIGRTLGIYGGHAGHEGHISRTVLALMEAEGIAQQDERSKHWRLKKHGNEDSA